MQTNAPAAAQPLPASPSISTQAIAAGPQDYNALLQQLKLDAMQSMQQPYAIQMLPQPGQIQFTQPQMQVTGPMPLLPTPANQQGFVPIAAPNQQGFRPITAQGRSGSRIRPHQTMPAFAPATASHQMQSTGVVQYSRTWTATPTAASAIDSAFLSGSVDSADFSGSDRTIRTSTDYASAECSVSTTAMLLSIGSSCVCADSSVRTGSCKVAAVSRTNGTAETTNC